jgi:hypothetical protein
MVSLRSTPSVSLKPISPPRRIVGLPAVLMLPSGERSSSKSMGTLMPGNSWDRSNVTEKRPSLKFAVTGLSPPPPEPPDDFNRATSSCAVVKVALLEASSSFSTSLPRPSTSCRAVVVAVIVRGGTVTVTVLRSGRRRSVMVKVKDASPASVLEDGAATSRWLPGGQALPVKLSALLAELAAAAELRLNPATVLLMAVTRLLRAVTVRYRPGSGRRGRLPRAPC